MSELTKKLRKASELAIDNLEMANFSEGFETATNGLDDLADIKHNAGDHVAAEILRWAAKELRGENV